MNTELEKYFIPNTEASCIWKDGKRRLVSVKDNTIRAKTAREQALKEPTSIYNVFGYVNEFLDMLLQEGTNDNNIGQILLDGKEHHIINHGIIVKNCIWKSPIWDGNKYVFWDEKYDVIKNKFYLNYANDIIWLKFTSDGYVGVVADSFDINFDYSNSSGKLLKLIEPEKYWDDSFVFIFPLTPNMLAIKERKKLETAIGNYLLDKGVAIIDYYSHNNFNI